MKPAAILSCDCNPDYLSLLPIVCKSWELQGFFTDITINGDSDLSVVKKYISESNSSIQITNEEIPSINKALFVQCFRMYVPEDYDDSTYCILSDADMFIASSFLYRDFHRVNVFGHDLTGFGHIPMCYVGMTVPKWREVMKPEPGNWGGLTYDLQYYADKDSSDWYKAWGADQDILTAKLKLYGFHKINFINRETDQNNSGLPLGRWDRYNWQKPAGEIHDVHLMRSPLSDENFPKIVEMCNAVYPKEDWSWLHEYRNEFLKSMT